MEFDLNNQPNFTDKKILRLINTMSWIDFTSKTVSDEIRLGESSISILLELEGDSCPLSLIFRARGGNLLGAFTYGVHINPTDTECELYFAQCLFLENFGNTNSYLVKSKAIEKLMEYPDIKEWLLWNRP